MAGWAPVVTRLCNATAAAALGVDPSFGRCLRRVSIPGEPDRPTVLPLAGSGGEDCRPSAHDIPAGMNAGGTMERVLPCVLPCWRSRSGGDGHDDDSGDGGERRASCVDERRTARGASEVNLLVELRSWNGARRSGGGGEDSSRRECCALGVASKRRGVSVANGAVRRSREIADVGVA